MSAPNQPGRIPVPRAVYDGLEAVRRLGLTNMLDRPRVAELALELGHPKLALNYDYDTRDLPIKRTETSTATTVTVWTYDLEGRLLREKRTSGVSVVFDEIVTYDAAGNLRTRKRDAAGQASTSYTYKYDFDALLLGLPSACGWLRGYTP